MAPRNAKTPQKPVVAKASGRAGDEKRAVAQPSTRAVGGRPSREELTPQQLRGITALLTNPTIAGAAAEIGVHPRTMSRWFEERAFLAEYSRQMTELQLELWRGMLTVRSEVWDRFLKLTHSTDERVALRATTWFLDRMLSVPSILSRIASDHGEVAFDGSPRLRAFLDEVGTVDRGDHHDAS